MKSIKHSRCTINESSYGSIRMHGYNKNPISFNLYSLFPLNFSVFLFLSFLPTVFLFFSFNFSTTDYHPSVTSTRKFEYVFWRCVHSCANICVYIQLRCTNQFRWNFKMDTYAYHFTRKLRNTMITCILIFFFFCFKTRYRVRIFSQWMRRVLQNQIYLQLYKIDSYSSHESLNRKQTYAKF